jgi:putative transposase
LRKQRDNHSAYAFIKRLIKQFGKPQKVITDQAPSTKVAIAKVIKAFKLKPDCHCTSKYLNNLIEQDHRHIKVRKRQDIKVSIRQKIHSKALNVFTLYIKRTADLFRSTDFRHATKLGIC